jgi:outer membrane lipoprotein SlyB
MQNWMIVGVALLSLSLMPTGVEAKGCLKGAAVGGVAGHMVGKGHGVAGAAAGCAIGHHEANKKEKKAAQQSNTGNARNDADNGQRNSR